MLYHVKRTFAAYVTEYFEVESDSEDSVQDSQWEFVGISVGDSIPWVMDPQDETVPAISENLPENLR